MKSQFLFQLCEASLRFSPREVTTSADRTPALMRQHGAIKEPVAVTLDVERWRISH